ncbi:MULTISPECIES: alpha/beta fold hydrolase [Neobacillus]|uniref:Alpha/beta hydrolase n=1 Tax=Neobacillus rhizophilus TaxID=2833579 RepID=A0A942U464_9BACI|nr:MULTISPECIES: alpha/beta hydrolase [Neobacillus]MBS4214386.1 alpha/beta hydrolase [Neobacillus rhizophilus]MBU8915822.1 alpha/beta hydrolase [Bacillus sp. FJAT-29953]
MIENTMKLPDGRRLGYAEYGQQDGFPIIAMHGTPGARILGAFSRLEQMGQNPSAKPFRIFVMERSGYGLSTPQPGRTIDNVVEDTKFFADRIGLEQFAVFGGSGGAPFVLSCCQRLPHRVTKAAISAGVGPVYLPNFFENISDEEKAFLKGAMGDSEAIVTFAKDAQADPVGFIKELLAQSNEQIPAEIPDAFIQMIVESTKSPYGMIDDYRCFGQPWNVSFEDIRTPVQFWHSDADESVPISHAEYLAEKIPGAALRRFHNLSHIETSHAALPEVLDFLAE